MNNKMNSAQIIKKYGHINMKFTAFNEGLYIFDGKSGKKEITAVINEEINTIYSFFCGNSILLEKLMQYATDVWINDKVIWERYVEEEFK